jgi:hypothetical protein
MLISPHKLPGLFEKEIMVTRFVVELKATGLLDKFERRSEVAVMPFGKIDFASNAEYLAVLIAEQ